MITKRMNKFLIFICICIILLFFILNTYTPILADDYSLSNITNSFNDIFFNQYNYYLNWGGRIIGNSFSQLFLLIGKPYFNIVNTIVYFIFILLIQFHITGSIKHFNPILFIIINSLFWFLTPVWGQNFLWLNGSCIYLWPTTINLFFLVPYRKRNINSNYNLNIPLSILFLFLSFLSGFSTENSGAAVLFLLLLYFIFKIIKKNNFSLFEILGFIGFIIGYSMLIASPGNYVRFDLILHEDNYYKNVNIILRFTKMFFKATELFFRSYGFLLLGISLIIILDYIYKKKEKINSFCFFYFLAAMAGSYSMILSPYYPPRASLIVTVFSIITLGSILKQINFQLPGVIRRNPNIFILILMIFLAFSFADAARGIIEVYLRWYDRIELILTEKNNGIFDIEVNPIIPRNRHVALYDLNDLDTDKNFWTNTAGAQYFNLRSIKSNYIMVPVFTDFRKDLNRLIVPPWDKLKEARELIK